jgi:threonine/homoserine/homoserine lactone efflux protein
MHILLIILGALLALFGGACTLLVAGLSGGNSILMGLLPLGAGLLLIWAGIEMGRAKRKNAKPED